MSMIVKCDKKGIEKASKIISEGGVVVFPTDTVYGIGCDPYNKSSVEKIYQIKKRSKEKPLPILGYSLSTINEIVEFDEESKKIAEVFWPGPLTLILKLKDEKLKEILRVDKIAARVPDNQCLLDILKNCKFLIGTSANYSGEGSFTNSKECLEKLKEILKVDKIAVRVPDNQCLLDILKDSKFLIGTSANYSGENSFTNSKECWEKLKEHDIFVDGGNISSEGESTILEISHGKLVIHREGALKKEEITRVF